MSGQQILGLVLGSAAVGALVSSLINGLFALMTKRLELQRQDESFAARLTEIKHQQLIAAQEWAIKTEGRPRQLDLWDPIGHCNWLRARPT